MSYAAGYWLTACGFTPVAALLATRWRAHFGARWLLLATLCTIAWAVGYGVSLGSRPLPVGVLYALDVLRLGAWLALLAWFLVKLGFPRPPLQVVNGVWLAVIAVLVFPQLGGAAGELSFVVFQAAPGISLLLVAVGLLLIEQLFRNAPRASRLRIKYLCYAAGTALAFDLYFYSDVLWLTGGGLDVVGARGYVQFLGLPFLLFAAGLEPPAEPEIELSHGTVFFTTAVTAVGAYLAFVIAGSYYVERIGGSWGEVAQVTFLAAAFLALFTLLFSDRVRARFRVFVQKHFQRYKYDYRREWLRFTQTLSRAAGEAEILRTSINAMADIVGSHGGAMWVAEEGSGVYRPVASVPASHPAEGSVRAGDDLVAFLDERGWIVDLAEYAREPERYAPLSLPGWLAEREAAWLVIPLLLGGALTGFVVLDRVAAPPTLNFEDHDLLKTVGRDVAIHISQFEASRKLAENRQFSAYHRFSAFVMHDLKNLVAQLSLLAKNAEKHRHNPAFIDDAILTIEHSVARMDRLIAQLGERALSEQRTRVSVSGALRRAVALCTAAEPVPELTLGSEEFVLADADELVSVFMHLLRNAQDATPGDGEVRVSVDASGDAVTVTFVDNGVGMAPAFVRERLFRPFETTKGAAGMGIGAYHALEYVRGLGGEIVVDSAPGRGSRFEVRLPRLKTSARSHEEENCELVHTLRA